MLYHSTFSPFCHQSFVGILDGIAEELVANVMPLLKLRPAFHRSRANLRRSCQDLNDFNQEKIEERKRRLEEEGYDDPRDFIECYLKVRE